MSYNRSYFADIEETLLALSGVAGNAGHSVVKGGAREFFVKDFLAKNISPLWNVGSGEIIHRGTQVSDKRNQIDVVIYNSQFPKFEKEPGVHAYMAESGIIIYRSQDEAHKGSLEASDLHNKRIKDYPRDVTQIVNPNALLERPRLYTSLQTFDGCKIETLTRWLTEANEELGISLDALIEMPLDERYHFDNRSIDGIFILNKGYAFIDASPLNWGKSVKSQHPERIWNCGKDNSLMMFWLYINEVNKILSWNQFNLTRYIWIVEGFIWDGKE